MIINGAITRSFSTAAYSFISPAIRQFNASRWGWVGDGTTDNSAAYAAMIREINERKGNVVVTFDAGTFLYKVVETNPRAERQIRYCSRVTFQGQGTGSTTLKILDGALCRNFDSGQPQITTYSEGWGFFCRWTNEITLRNMTWDGNLANLTITAAHDGMCYFAEFFGCDTVVISNVNIDRPGTTGLHFNEDLTHNLDNKNVDVRNVIVDSDRVNGMEINQMIGGQFTNCQFLRSGSVIGKGPNAGVDVEPASATAFVDDVTFTNCKFSDCEGFGWIRDVGQVENATNILLTGCTFETQLSGAVAWAFWSSSPYVTVENSTILGAIINRAGMIRTTTITHNETLYNDRAIHISSSGYPNHMEDCTVKVSGGRRCISTEGTPSAARTFTRVAFEITGNDLAAGQWWGQVGGLASVLTDCTVNHFGTAPASPYIFNNANGSTLTNCTSLKPSAVTF
jgi:hypothetical protein